MKLFDVARSKKGGLDVSINSVVIIIFAVTILGLGLAFIRSQFSKIDVITIPVPDTPATRDNPVVVPNEIELKTDRDNVITVGVYNSGSKQNFEPKLECASSNIVAQSAKQDIGQGESRYFQFIFKKGNAAGEYAVCNFVFDGNNGGKISKQVVIKTV